MPFVKHNKKHLTYLEDEPPSKKLMSEGDMFIKKLADKQKNQEICLQEYLKDDKKFEKVSEHISVTSCHSGASSLEEFKMAIDQIGRIENFRSYNLTNEDVKLILDYQDGTMYDKYKNLEPSVLQTRITRILHVIQDYKGKPKASELRIPSRNQMEALAIKPNSIETKLLKFVLENKNSNSPENLRHPMDNILQIEHDMFSHIFEDQLSTTKVQKQIRRYANKIHNIGSVEQAVNAESVVAQSLKSSEAYSFVTKSKWDQQVTDTSLPITKSPEKIFTCKPQNFYTIKDGQIIKLGQNNTINGIQDFTKRLSVEEIKAMPKFKTYEIGLPSKILYLKNLPKQIQESDLHRIFAEFIVDNTLLFRVMTGKMKGQAFVTFPDEETASKALYTTNGLLLNEKPVIIQFGKK